MSKLALVVAIALLTIFVMSKLHPTLTAGHAHLGSEQLQAASIK